MIKKTIEEVFVPPEILNRAFPAPREIDLFGLETQSRKIIGELFRPMQEDMDHDRRKVAGVEMSFKAILSRIGRLEYICNMEGNKPKVFMDLDNRFIDLEVAIKAS